MVKRPAKPICILTPNFNWPIQWPEGWWQEGTSYFSANSVVDSIHLPCELSLLNFGNAMISVPKSQGKCKDISEDNPTDGWIFHESANKQRKPTKNTQNGASYATAIKKPNNAVMTSSSRRTNPFSNLNDALRYELHRAIAKASKAQVVEGTSSSNTSYTSLISVSRVLS